MTVNRLKIMPIFGTRPEAIKMAPLVQLLTKDGPFEIITTVTAQHREMLDQVLHLFRIKPDFDLNIMATSQSLSDITSKVLRGMEDILKNVKPDLILVHGDTTTTFAASLAAFYQQTSVGHVEAGLRTYQKYSPYPEEMNRKLTGSLADLHFAPTQAAKQSLLREGVLPDRIQVTGNTVIDALLETVTTDYCFEEPLLRDLDFLNQKILLLTSHRRENLGRPMVNIFEAVRDIIMANPDVRVVFPVHKNPEVRKLVNDVLGECPRVHLIEPLDYEPFANLIAKSHLVLTDSGGIQEEAPAVGKPVLVLRDTTERPEAVASGTVKLVGTDRAAIVRAANQLLQNPVEYLKMANAVNPYGDGRASQRIMQGLLRYFRMNESEPEEWNN